MEEIKNVFFKRFQGVKEEEFFSILTRLQQKGDVDEYTREWETLATRVPGLSETRLILSYTMGLKLHLQAHLELHDITSIEVARQKAKAAEKKHEKMQWPKVERVYSK